MICGAVKMTCSQAKPPKVFEQSNRRLQSYPRWLRFLDQIVNQMFWNL